MTLLGGVQSHHQHRTTQIQSTGYIPKIRPHTLLQPLTQMVPKGEEVVRPQTVGTPVGTEKLNLGTTCLHPCWVCPGSKEAVGVHDCMCTHVHSRTLHSGPRTHTHPRGYTRVHTPPPSTGSHHLYNQLPGRPSKAISGGDQGQMMDKQACLGPGAESIPAIHPSSDHRQKSGKVAHRKMKEKQLSSGEGAQFK